MTRAKDQTRDVVVVGGGLSGSVAALVLGRRGYRVTLIDRHKTYPADFRAEQIAGRQVDLLRSLGLFEVLAAGADPAHRVLNARAGRAIDWTEAEHYGLPYEAMVNAARAALPPAVELRLGRVAAIEAGPERQRALLADGKAVEGRLLVLATGFGTALRESLGISRRVIRDGHSLTLGFGVAPGPGAPVPLTYYGWDPSQRVDYLKLFPMAGAVRANLFAYQGIREPWARAFNRDPAAALRSALPGLERFLGDFRVAGPVQMRVSDLHAVTGHVRDGVVLIGEAFQTSCPAAGTGIERLLTDIDRLCHYLPAWFTTPGMAAAKIAAFYDDPVKRAVDARSRRIAEYRLAAATGAGLRWALHRRRVYLQRRLRGWLREAAGRSHADGLRRAEPSLVPRRDPPQGGRPL